MGRRESEEGFVSRSELKRRSERVEELARELLKLGAGGIKQAPLSDCLRQELLHCQTLRGPALKRQVKYLARLLREEGNIDSIMTHLEDKRGSKLKQDSAFHELERLRNLLVDEVIACYDCAVSAGETADPVWDGEVLASVAARFGAEDLRDLRAALFTFARSRHKKYHRLILRILQTVVERDKRRQLFGNVLPATDEK